MSSQQKNYQINHLNLKSTKKDQKSPFRFHHQKSENIELRDLPNNDRPPRFTNISNFRSRGIKSSRGFDASNRTPEENAESLDNLDFNSQSSESQSTSENEFSIGVESKKMSESVARSESYAIGYSANDILSRLNHSKRRGLGFKSNMSSVKDVKTPQIYPAKRKSLAQRISGVFKNLFSVYIHFFLYFIKFHRFNGLPIYLSLLKANLNIFYSKDPKSKQNF